MFLNLLNDRQKQSFLALATKVVMADGEVAPKEHVTLNVRVSEMLKPHRQKFLVGQTLKCLIRIAHKQTLCWNCS